MQRRRRFQGIGPRVAIGVFCLSVASAYADDSASVLSSIRVPDGFVVERVAGPPLVKYPMLGAFDGAGRLFVCESAGQNLDAQQLLDRLPNFIRMLEDTDGDGVFDRSSVFADKMTLPAGAMWHDGALYVASPPSIWRLHDSDGDGVADQRDELITGFNFRGHAGDVHGPYLGPNGRLFFVDGTMGHKIQDKNGRLLSKGTAARVFSSRLDGSDLETFCGGGMANPVAVTFTEEGEMFVATTFFNYSPRERIRHDAFFHAVYGGVYPRNVGYLRSEFKLTGPLLPPLSRFGMSAPSNLTTYRSGAFGAEYLGNIFISHFNTRCITRSRLSRSGSTYQDANEIFLSSSNPDFHPSDVIEDADGSLLVIDTGGWFKIGCPTSSLQPEVLGGIYRVRSRQRQPQPDPRGRGIAWGAASTELVKLLADDRFAVRDRAISTLARRGADAIADLKAALGSESLLSRRNAVWTLTRINSPLARAAARMALNDPDASVRIAACHSVATHRDTQSVEQLVHMLRDADPAVRRTASMALGRIGDPMAVAPLLQAFDAAAGDRMLEHATVYALIEINTPAETLPGLSNSSPRVRRAALVALDQMESGKLTRDLVRPLFESDDDSLLNALVDVVSRHPDWVETVTGRLTSWLLNPKLGGSRQTLVRDTIDALRNQPACQALMAELLSRPDTPVRSRILLLDVVIDSRFGEFPSSWLPAVLGNLDAADSELAQRALMAMASTESGQFDDILAEYAQDTTRPVESRVRAAGAISRSRRQLPQSSFELFRSQFDQEASFEARLAAARAMGGATLSSTQLAGVVDLVPEAGPIELPLLLDQLANLWHDDLGKSGQTLITALNASPGFASLNEEQLTKLFEGAPGEARAAAEPLFERLRDEYSTSIRQVLRTVFILKGGNAARGKEIFFGKQALCSACHRVEPDAGGEIGPDLSRIGEVRGLRDLLEAILVPSASFARGFESKSVVTSGGKVISGVIRKETNDTITLYTSQREEFRIARTDIEEIIPSKVSAMPRGLERSLTSDDLRDLLAYLSSLRSSVPGD